MSSISSIIATTLKPGNEYMRAVIIRLIIFAAALFISSVLIIIGIAFLVWSSFLYLNTILSSYFAALISGLIAIIISGLVFLIVNSLTKGSGGKSSEVRESKAPGFMDASQVVEAYPLESGLMAMAAGFIAGSSPDSKKVLTELFVTLSQNSSK